MVDRMDDFRKKLLASEETSPELKEAYRKGVEELVSPPLTARAKVLGVVLLVLMVGTAAAIVRADLMYSLAPLVVVAHLSLGIACLWGAWKIVGSLRSGKYSQQSVVSISSVLTGAAGIMTVVVMMIGLGHSSEPKSTFDMLYLFVFYFSCAVWGIESKIAAAELASREQALRIEYRLAELAERMGK